MQELDEQERRLPSREVSYDFTVAMYFAQQLELDLRAILYALDYHGWGAEIRLTRDQIKRFKSTDNLIDQATCGLVMKQLRATGTIKSKDAWLAFDRACKHRNELAHTFLVNQDFQRMTKKTEAALISHLRQMALDLYQALTISRKVRSKLEGVADDYHKSLQETFRDFGAGSYDNPNRHYATKKRTKRSR